MYIKLRISKNHLLFRVGKTAKVTKLKTFLGKILQISDKFIEIYHLGTPLNGPQGIYFRQIFLNVYIDYAGCQRTQEDIEKAIENLKKPFEYLDVTFVGKLSKIRVIYKNPGQLIVEISSQYYQEDPLKVLPLQKGLSNKLHSAEKGSQPIQTTSSNCEVKSPNEIPLNSEVYNVVKTVSDEKQLDNTTEKKSDSNEPESQDIQSTSFQPSNDDHELTGSSRKTRQTTIESFIRVNDDNDVAMNQDNENTIQSPPIKRKKLISTDNTSTSTGDQISDISWEIQLNSKEHRSLELELSQLASRFKSTIEYSSPVSNSNDEDVQNEEDDGESTDEADKTKEVVEKILEDKDRRDTENEDEEEAEKENESAVVKALCVTTPKDEAEPVVDTKQQKREESTLLLVEKSQRSVPKLDFKKMSAEDFERELHLSKKRFVYQCNKTSTLKRVSLNEMKYDPSKRLIKIDDFDIYPHNVFATVINDDLLIDLLPGRMFAAYLKIFGQRKALYAVNLLDKTDCQMDEAHVNLFVADFGVYKSVKIKRNTIKYQLQFSVADVLTKGTNWTWNEQLDKAKSQTKPKTSITEDLKLEYVSENIHDTFGKIRKLDKGFLANDRETLATKRVHKSREHFLCTKNGYLCSIIINDMFLVRDCGSSFIIKGRNKKGRPRSSSEKMLFEIFVVMEKFQDRANQAASKTVRVVRSSHLQNKYSPKTGFRYEGLFKLRDVTEVDNHIQYQFILV